MYVFILPIIIHLVFFIVNESTKVKSKEVGEEEEKKRMAGKGIAFYRGPKCLGSLSVCNNIPLHPSFRVYHRHRLPRDLCRFGNHYDADDGTNRAPKRKGFFPQFPRARNTLCGIIRVQTGK